MVLLFLAALPTYLLWLGFPREPAYGSMLAVATLAPLLLAAADRLDQRLFGNPSNT